MPDLLAYRGKSITFELEHSATERHMSPAVQILLCTLSRTEQNIAHCSCCTENNLKALSSGFQFGNRYFIKQPYCFSAKSPSMETSIKNCYFYEPLRLTGAGGSEIAFQTTEQNKLHWLVWISPCRWLNLYFLIHYYNLCPFLMRLLIASAAPNAFLSRGDSYLH